jgi:hypothetical protein
MAKKPSASPARVRPCFLAKASLVHYERALDMRTGTLTREVIWEKSSGKRIRIRSRRLVSFVHRHLAAIDYEVEMVNADAPIVLCSQLRYLPAGEAQSDDPRATRAFGEGVLIPEHHNHTHIMPDNLNMEELTEARRKAVADSIRTISVEELKTLGEALFPCFEHPWRLEFYNFLEENPGDAFYHAVTHDRLHIIYCRTKEKGMWFLLGSGRGVLQPKWDGRPGTM